jgi:predicted dehydrogenase
MKNAWPVKCIAAGGRHYRGDSVDQNFDTYSMEYTFEDGTKLFMNGRTMPGCYQDFSSYAHGTKGLAVISNGGHWPSRARIYKGHAMTDENVIWSFGQEKNNPYVDEWKHLIAAIRNNEKYNEVERGAMASLVTSMGRMAAHTGQEITLEQMMNSEHEFAPDIEKLTLESESPLKADETGRYPIPLPGLEKSREYVS